MRAMRWKLGAAATALAVALTGCEPERSRWDVELQPDGSGRVRLVHETAGEMQVHPDEEPGDEGEADELAELQALRFLSTIEGVSAWTDVHATPLPGGRARVEATGWFRSLADVRVLDEPRFGVSVVGGALEVEYRDPIPRGLSELFLSERAKVQEAFDDPDERFDASVHRTRGFVEMSLAGWAFDLRVRMPGRVVEASGFERVGDDAVRMRQDVESVLALLDADLTALREVRAQVRDGVLGRDQGYAALGERMARGPTFRARCEVEGEAPDAEFARAFEEARAAWDASEWKARLEAVARPK